MMAHKVALAAALSLCAAGAHAQERRIQCYPDPRDPQKLYCPEQGPQLKAGHARVPARPRTTSPQPGNPGTDGVISRFTTDPIEAEAKRLMRLPGWVPLSTPSPGQIVCLGTEPCGVVADTLWPAETSRNQTIRSRDTALAIRELNKLEEALRDPSSYPTYEEACWPRAALERRRCAAEVQVLRGKADDVARSRRLHHEAYETNQMIGQFRDVLGDPNLDPQMRQWGEQELRNWERRRDSFERRQIAPEPPPATVRMPVPPPLKGQRPTTTRRTGAPVQRNCPAGASCGSQ